MISVNELVKYVDTSVLCWLATTSADGQPNVSPKEVFDLYGRHHLIVANIASPQTVRNIQQNPKTCISFIDIFSQKGCQIKGHGQIISSDNPDYAQMRSILEQKTQGKYPFETITAIHIEHIKAIIAPKYFLFPETTEEDQIREALNTYRCKDKSDQLKL